jgi:hypothetical protein
MPGGGLHSLIIAILPLQQNAHNNIIIDFNLFNTRLPVGVWFMRPIICAFLCFCMRAFVRAFVRACIKEKHNNKYEIIVITSKMQKQARTNPQIKGFINPPTDIKPGVATPREIYYIIIISVVLSCTGPGQWHLWDVRTLRKD